MSNEANAPISTMSIANPDSKQVNSKHFVKNRLYNNLAPVSAFNKTMPFLPMSTKPVHTHLHDDIKPNDQLLPIHIPFQVKQSHLDKGITITRLKAL